MTNTTNHNQKNNSRKSYSKSKAHQQAGGKTDVKQVITDRIVALMERGTEAWQKTWKVAAAAGMPCNASTGAPYRGVNILILWAQCQEAGFRSNRWMTYKQAQAVGAQVRKGEKSVTCVYFEMMKRKEPQEGEAEFFPMAKAFNLFNLDQIDNLPEDLKEPTETDMTPPPFSHDELAEQFIEATGARIEHHGNRAFYRPSTDTIVLPEPEAFIAPANYYATACHELTHWTGHASRLDRDFSKSRRFGDETYAFEELVAELGSSFLAGHFGFIDATVENHASYLASWIKVLKNDKSAIFTAAKHASAAYEYLAELTADATEQGEEQAPAMQTAA